MICWKYSIIKCYEHNNKKLFFWPDKGRIQIELAPDLVIVEKNKWVNSLFFLWSNMFEKYFIRVEGIFN